MRRPRPLLPRAMPVLVTAISLVLASCGFTPLYATPGVTPALTRIAVATPDGRTGHLLREQLDDQLATDHHADPRYRLALHYDERRYERGLRVDNTADRIEVLLAVDWTLTDAASGAVVAGGRVAPSVTYDSADQPYAGVSANLDAQERAAAEAARLITLDLARFFATRPAA